MTIFETLLLAHILGDWLLQTEWQAVNKGRNWRALLSHVAVYHAVVLVALILKVGTGEPRVYIVLILLAATHTLLDREGVVSGLMRGLRIIRDRPPERWLKIAVDQSIHLLLLGAATLILAG